MAVALPLISIAAGVGTVAAATTVAATIAGAAAIVSGVATLAGKPKIAKIAGIVALGAGAYAAFVDGASAFGAKPTDAAAPAAPLSSATDVTTASTDVATAFKPPELTASVQDVIAAAPKTTQMLPSESVLDVARAGVQGQSFPSAAQAQPTFLDQVRSAGSAAMDKLKAVGPTIKENKELAQLAGGALYGAYGPEAQAVALRERAMATEAEELERRKRNANNILALVAPKIYSGNTVQQGPR